MAKCPSSEPALSRRPVACGAPRATAVAILEAGVGVPDPGSALIALPDARLIQAMTLTMLDAGERAANPPMVGVAVMQR